jgi:hypothetical protein
MNCSWQFVHLPSSQFYETIPTSNAVVNDRFSYLATHNHNKLHDFHCGNIRWAQFKNVITNTPIMSSTLSNTISRLCQNTLILQPISVYFQIQ